jgi:hypothetical protein
MSRYVKYFRYFRPRIRPRKPPTMESGMNHYAGKFETGSAHYKNDERVEGQCES